MSKDQIQSEVVDEIIKHNGHGGLQIATGVGKTKIVIDYIKKAEIKSVLWMVPTIKLRDKTIPAEFKKWDAEDIFKDYIQTICYKSINKLHDEEYDLIVMDEGHNITQISSMFFFKNKWNRILFLSATFPRYGFKYRFMEKLKINLIRTITVDDAVEDNLISAYTIFVINTKLDTQKVMSGYGFPTSEQSTYDYYTKKIASYPFQAPQQLYLQRMRAIYDSKNKVRAAKKVLSTMAPSLRVIIFASTIKAAESLCEYTYHSKTDDHHYALFNEKKINRLAVVDAINEGDNLVDIDVVVIVQANSNDRKYIQRQGRGLRWRSDHLATIYIIQAINTVDVDWVNKSLSSISADNIFHLNEDIL